VNRPAVWLLWVWLILVLMPEEGAHGGQAFAAAQPLTQASLQVQGRQEAVTLPHQLKPGQLEGEKINYTLQVDLDSVPVAPLAIYVAKMALSGKVSVNGHDVGACGEGALENLRCMHRPHLFTTPAVFWQLGRNDIRFEIYTDSTEINGLSSVWVGDAGVLRRDFYQWRQFMSVEFLATLSWISALLGALSLLGYFVLRSKPVYFWFGVTTLVHVVANIVSLMDVAVLDPRVFAWLVCSSRFVSVTLALLMYLAWFEKLTSGVTKAVVLYSVIGVLAIGLSNTHRGLLALLYVPLLISGVLLMGGMLKWSWNSQKPNHWTALFLSGVILAAAIHDFKKLLGSAAFQDMYLLTIAYTGVVVVLGMTVLGILVKALDESEKLRVTLEERVAERAAQLSRIHEVLLASEIKRTQTKERESLLRDVHDGFGSQLVTAHMLVKAQKLEQAEIECLLQECLDDLYLVIDISSHMAEYFQDVLLDFQSRVSRRLIGNPTRLHWDFSKENWPPISKANALQILRILQEALNNALKHSKSQNIWISAYFDSSSRLLKLKIADDGSGLPTQSHFGHGLKNMTDRARNLGGELKVTGTNEGTAVELLIPITLAHAQPNPGDVN
jgi:signal transduction histidine kinase